MSDDVRRARDLFLDALRDAGRAGEADTIAKFADLAATGAANPGDGVTFHPWTDGWGVGFRVVHDDTGDVEHLYLHPSSATDHGNPDAFLYHTSGEDPASGEPVCFVDVHEDKYPDRDPD